MAPEKRGLEDWAAHTYGEWLSSGGCSAGESEEMIVMDALQTDLFGLKDLTLQEMFDVPETGYHIRTTFQNHHMENYADFDC